MRLRFKVKEEDSIAIHANEPYSSIFLEVNMGEIYSFSVDKKDKWRDLIITKNADGFNNLLVPKEKLRLPEAKCFELCATIDRNEENHFKIGTNRLEYKTPKSGKLYFFANDSKKLNKEGKFRWYENNRGCIQLTIIRLK